jgi:hypothetical protein
MVAIPAAPVTAAPISISLRFMIVPPFESFDIQRCRMHFSAG